MKVQAAAISTMLCAGLAHAQWTHYGRDASRVSAIASAAPDLSAPAWTVSQTSMGQAVTFDSPTGMVADGGRAFAIGLVDGARSLIAFETGAGGVLWHAPIVAGSLDTWSSPVLAGDAVVAPSEDELVAFDAATGDELWRTALLLPVVNASPLVTNDLGPADRLFITDYDGSFASFDGGSLYCINIDPFDAQSNLFQPGQIVWRVGLIAATSGNSPAYENGVVYVADAGDPFFGDAGAVHAFDATATAPPTALWRTENPAGDGFFGGVSIADGSVYAASYAFFGGQNAGTLVKLDAVSGSLLWAAPANRTSSTPIPLPGSRVLLSAGVDGFGSAPSLQLFDDLGGSASQRWDTALATWSDDGDGAIEPGEYTPFGGWTHLPLVLDGDVAVAGTLPVGALFGAYQTLSLIDLGKAPSDAGFVIDSATLAGSTPALVDGLLLTAGPGGLTAYRAGNPLDVDGSGDVNVEDLYAWHAAPVDVNSDGSADAGDAVLLETTLREGSAP